VWLSKAEKPGGRLAPVIEAAPENGAHGSL